MLSAVFSLPGSILILKVCKPGAKTTACRFGIRLRLNGAARGLVPFRFVFRPAPFLIKPGEKTNLHSLLPGGVLGSRAVAVSLCPAAALSLVCVAVPVSACRVPESGNPAPLFRKPLLSPYRFLRLPLLAKTRNGLVLGVRSPAALSPRPCFFSSPVSLYVFVHWTNLRRKPDRHSLSEKKTGRPAAARSFFLGKPIDKHNTRSYNHIVAGTHKPTAFAEHRYYNT